LELNDSLDQQSVAEQARTIIVFAHVHNIEGLACEAAVAAMAVVNRILNMKNRTQMTRVACFAQDIEFAMVENEEDGSKVPSIMTAELATLSCVSFASESHHELCSEPTLKGLGITVSFGVTCGKSWHGSFDAQNSPYRIHGEHIRHARVMATSVPKGVVVDERIFLMTNQHFTFQQKSDKMPCCNSFHAFSLATDTENKKSPSKESSFLLPPSSIFSSEEVESQFGSSSGTLTIFKKGTFDAGWDDRRIPIEVIPLQSMM